MNLRLNGAPLPSPRPSDPRRAGLLPLLGALLLAAPGSAQAGSEYISLTEAVPPNILFVVDMSASMNDPCPDGSGSGGTSIFSTNPCYEDVFDAIEKVAQHFDWAHYGVVGTSDDLTVSDGYFPIVPLGTPYAELSAKLSATLPHATTTSNIAEAVADVGENYLSNSTASDGVDSDGDGFDLDWAEAPIEFSCQKTHIIVITPQRPEGDTNPSSSWTASLPTKDVTCDTGGRTTSTDTECLYDNVVYGLYNGDMRSDLLDTQNVTVHTLGLGIPGTAVAEELFGNASDQIGGAGLYASATSADEVLSSILLMMQDIRSGSFTRSTPVLSAAGNYLIYTYYELNGDEEIAQPDGMALGQGHIRAYAIDDDPTSSTYGQVVLTGPTEFGGAVWDGGTLLVSRLVTPSESNLDDRDGVGRRDIYTFFEPAYSLGGSLMSEADNDGRMGFDYDFVTEVAMNPTALDAILDTSISTTTAPCANDQTWDFFDDCLVDGADLQSMVDFARGYNDSTFRYFDSTRGRWRLGDSPYSIPVVVEARNNTYAIDPTYRKFLDELIVNEEAGVSPDIVLLAANDGMLHAFSLNDNPSTADTEEGEELWAWIPGYLLYRDHDIEWAGRLADLMLYGRTFLFDGSPVVEDVWVDANEDGVKDCKSVPDDCEWRRVVVVQQGKGGPVTLALDITDTDSPKFLWEQWDTVDKSAIGYTMGRPVIANVYDTSDPGNVHDRWVALWGSGRAVPYSASTDYYTKAESNLYMWHIGDDFWGTSDVGYQDDSGTGHPRGDNNHPQSGSVSSLDVDGDGHYEYAYISAALAVVDTNSDGDADTMYFPVTTTYTATDEGGGGPSDVQDPGSTWMYKACIDPTDPGNLTWIEFFDPKVDGGLSERPEVFYAATTAWQTDGSLGVYWGTGTPFGRSSSSSAGYFFAVRDTDPSNCDTDTMQPIDDCGANGVYTMETGEGLTADPIVYAGVVYYSTWKPALDLCDGGTGRLYGLDYRDCAAGIDTDGSGAVTSDDLAYVETAGSYISGVAVSDKGTLFYGSSAYDETGTGIGTITANNPFLGTATLAWMEVF
jgi:hypothetical protein